MSASFYALCAVAILLVLSFLGGMFEQSRRDRDQNARISLAAQAMVDDSVRIHQQSREMRDAVIHFFNRPQKAPEAEQPVFGTNL